jgi:hypothetical protein
MIEECKVLVFPTFEVIPVSIENLSEVEIIDLLWENFGFSITLIGEVIGVFSGVLDAGVFKEDLAGGL